MKRKTSIALGLLVTATTVLAPSLKANAAPQIVPYGTVEAELDFTRNVKDVFTEEDGVTTAVSLENGNYFSMRTVNFSKGVSKISVKLKAEGAGVIVIHKGDENGETVGTIRYSATSGYQEFSTDVTNLADTDYFTFENKVGTCAVDSWKAVPGETQEPETPDTPDTPEVPDTPDTPEQPPVGDTVNPYSAVEAESAASTDMSGAMVTPKKNAVNLVQGNSYVAYKNVNFAQGVESFDANVSANAAAMLEVRLDSATGDKVAAFRLSKNSEIQTQSAKATSAVTGTHDVYFVVASGSGVTLDSWVAKTSEGGEEPPVVEPPVGDTVNPYEKVEAEIATADDLSSAMVTPSKDKVVINENGSVTVKNVDFSQGASAINVYAQSAKPMVKVNVYIDDVQAGTAGLGTDITKPTAITLSSGITGVHTVRFEAKGGSVTLDGWQAVAGGGEEPPVVEPPVGDTVNPYSAVEAESAASTDMSNARVTPKKDAVSLTQANSYVAYKNVNFAQGVAEFNANVSAGSAAMLEVRLDSATGDKVAAFRLSQNSTIETKTAKATAAITGTHDVYFVVTAGTGVTLDSWVAKTSEGGEEPPVVEPPVGDTVDPYRTNEAETAASTDMSNARVTPKKDAVSLTQTNSYVAIKNVNFAKGVAEFNVNVSASTAAMLEVRLDSATGDKVAAFRLAQNSTITTQTTKALANVTGTHDVYFVVAAGSGITLDSWSATASGGGVVEPPVGDTVNPYSAVEAETAASTDMSGAMVTPKKNAVNLVQANSYVAYKNVNFAQGVTEFNANVSANAAAMLEVRLDSATGDKVAAFRLSKNSEIQSQTAKATAAITGTHDVYFVVASGSGVTLDSWVAKTSGDQPPVVEPPVGDTINPYAKVEAEIATAEQLTSAMITPSKDKVVINENGYVLVQNIDFSKGVSAFNVYAQASKPKVSLNVYIDDSQTPAGTVAVGTDITKPVTINVSSDITGVHYIYFEAKGGQVTLDGWQAAAAGEKPPVNPPATNVDPYTSVDATTASVLSGALVTPSKTAVNITPNGSAGTQNVNFTDGVSQFVITASSTSTGKIEVRLNSASGPLLGSATISGDSKEYTITASKNITGKQTIYFVNSGSGVVNVYSWKATAYSEPVVIPDPPVEQTGMDLSYTINSWTDGYQVSFKVTNKSGSTKNSWKVKVKKSDINLTQSWCVNVSQEGDYYVFTPMSWNSTLTNGQTTEFGIIGSGKVGSTINYTVE